MYWQRRCQILKESDFLFVGKEITPYEVLIDEIKYYILAVRLSGGGRRVPEYNYNSVITSRGEIQFEFFGVRDTILKFNRG